MSGIGIGKKPEWRSPDLFSPLPTLKRRATERAGLRAFFVASVGTMIVGIFGGGAMRRETHGRASLQSACGFAGKMSGFMGFFAVFSR
jgi:hypothetical protein